MPNIKKSAGLILYRKKEELEFFLVHPGGPFWKNKDIGAWSIPKGEFEEDEPALDAAIREFAEETGLLVSGYFTELKPVKLKSGKIIFAWAIEHNIDLNTIRSDTFEMEWPPRSGKQQSFPEIDKGGWFSAAAAREKINPAQVAFIEEIESIKF